MGAGQGFKLISYTDQVVDVDGFHHALRSLHGIPIATVATAYDTADVCAFILVFNEALYFGQAMETSHISPQQFCDNGTSDPLPKHIHPILYTEFMMRQLTLPFHSPFMAASQCISLSAFPRNWNSNLAIDLNLPALRLNGNLTRKNTIFAQKCWEMHKLSARGISV